ncbi:MAG: adenosine monophosphate-protein transferase [Marinitoga sp. 4572_148]|nr:MAG: adenosine monophosphate-protein transferase [Marinitoga sp. 4572_148]
MTMKFEAVDIKFPEDCNVIVGQSHFIKTVEDVYEKIVTSVPGMKFGLAFNEASGPRLIRFDGNDEELVDIAIENAKNVGAGHFFILIIRNGYPINILPGLKQIQEIVNIFAATANPLQVLVAETDLGRGVIGVVDGQPPLDVEGEEDKKKRYDFLRNITGYKR